MTFEATSDAIKYLLSAGMIALAAGFCATIGYLVASFRRDGAVLGGVLGGIAGMGIGIIAAVVLVLDEEWFEAMSVTNKWPLSVGIILLATASCAMVGYAFLRRAGIVLGGISGLGIGMMVAAVLVCGAKWHGFHTG